VANKFRRAATLLRAQVSAFLTKLDEMDEG
jgi:hypothetical protein